MIGLGQNRQRYVVATRVLLVYFELCGYFVMISGPIIKVGNHVETAGMYVTIMRKMNIMPKNGSAARTTLIIGMPATPEVTNRFRPTGGVIIPISMFTTMMIPR